MDFSYDDDQQAILELARQILEDHGGTIRVSSRPGGGTTLVLALPMRPA